MTFPFLKKVSKIILKTAQPARNIAININICLFIICLFLKKNKDNPDSASLVWDYHTCKSFTFARYAETGTFKQKPKLAAI